jgi:hypothetical protein
MYGIQTNGEELVDCIRDHFGCRCYGLLNDDLPAYKPTTNFTMDPNFIRTELPAPDDIIEKYLKIKKDDKIEEVGPRMSTRNKEKTNTFY